MTSHPTRVIDIKRRLHGIEAVAYKPVCGCGWKGSEQRDPLLARRDAAMHCRRVVVV